MAIIWQKKVKQDFYQVSKAGNSVRLYSNGVFHSQYNPTHLLSHSIWDMLLLPAFFLPANSVKRILLMGVGGGTVIKLLHRYLQPVDITGVEINPVHLQVARKFFKVNQNEADLICADAIQWIKQYKGPKFDVIIDDMFGHAGGDINRAVVLDKSWFNILNRNLNPDGVVVINTTERNTLRDSAFFHDSHTRKQFNSMYTLRHPRYDNIVGAFFKQTVSKQNLNKTLMMLGNKKLQNAVFKMDYCLKRMV